MWYGAQAGLLRRRTGGFSRPGEPEYRPRSPPGDQASFRRALSQLFEDDRANIVAGLYPAPDTVRLRDLPRAVASTRLMFADADQVNQRRIARAGAEVREVADPSRYPAYYRQNFHYQSGGWFTEDSARLYDTQVEVLFGGTADVMRRAVLAELARDIRSQNRRDQTLLDLASGTGRFLSQVMDAYPRLNAIGVDLSPAYCAKARKTLSPWPNAQVVEGKAEAIPLEDDSVDLASCIYLFHELPPRLRQQAAREVFRVLKPGGLFVFGDSLQPGDNPCMDRRLEYFPEGFHEPYYRSYCTEDLDALFSGAGFTDEGRKLAFLTKVMRWRKPG